MEFHSPDYVRVTIDGSDRTDYVIGYTRQSSICSFSDTFGLELSFEIPTDPQPYDEIVIRELYDGDNEKVLSGYIIDVTQTGSEGSFVVNGQDKTLLLDDYFIPTQEFANGESAIYWINWYADQVGLDVQYDASFVSVFVVEPGTPMGMITCSEGLAMLERLAAVYIKYDANIDKLRVFRINTSEPVINITNDATTHFQRELSTDKTRNVVIVYGGYQYNIFTGQATQVVSKAVTNLSELVVDKTVVLANPLIRRTTVATLVASRILEIVDDIDDVLNIEVAGFYPEVDVGDYASIDIGREDFTYSADREITTIQTSVDQSGAITIFTVGEKCPRISIMPPLSVVYATALNGGVLVSWDGGESFEPFNRGLPGAVGEIASGLDGHSIAANKYGQLMSIVGSGIYKRTGKYGSWTEVTLPDPSNDEGEADFGVTDLELQKVEKESGYFGRFHILANATASGGIIPSGQERWWNYWTQSYGTSWDSMQLYTPGSGIVASGSFASGLPVQLYNGDGITHDQLLQYATVSGLVTWNVTARDIEGAISGNVTILVEGEPGGYIPEDTVAAETFYFSYVTYATTWSWRGATWWMDGSDSYQGTPRSNWAYGEEIKSDITQMKNMGVRVGNCSIFSVPNNREMCYSIVEKIIPAGSLFVGRTSGYRSNYGYQDVPTWEYISSADTSISVLDSFGLQAYSTLLDYSSLKPGDDKVRFCIIGAGLDGNSDGGDNYPSNTNIEINCYFFEDDITASGISSCTVTNDNRTIGISSYSGSPLSYAGEGTYGWTAQEGTTASPTPRGWASQQPMGQGAQPSCVTTNLTSTNYGYWAVMVRDKGHWHADNRDAGWPGTQHPRDWGEWGTIGIYVVKVNLTDMEIDSISLAQFWPPDWHDTIADTQPDRDDDIWDWANGTALRAMMTQPNLVFFQTRKGTGTANVLGHYLTYPGFGRTQHSDWAGFLGGDGEYSLPIGEWAGIRKTPFYSVSPVGYTSMGREDAGTFYTGDSDSRILYSNYTEDVVNIPLMPSGTIYNYRGHPDFGYCVIERRPVASGTLGQNPMTHDHLFLMKAQRATPYTFEEMGNSSRYSDPYAQTSYGLTYYPDWDFRTAWGSIPHPSGGDYFNWNWLSG